MQQEYERHGLHATWIKGAIEPGPFADGAERLRVGSGSGGCYLSDGWTLSRAGSFSSMPCLLPREELKRTLSLTFAGDGPARASWSAHAIALTRRDPQLRVEFVGWLDRDDVDRRMAAADLLVLPSVWPEPFGLVGLEAGYRRLPVAAFDVGGISEWLRPGVNGHLAPGDPPTATGLAEAIVACLRDRQTHDKLRDGAANVAAEFGLDEHIRALLETLRAAHGSNA